MSCDPTAISFPSNDGMLTASGENITDGIDGLAGGTLIFAFIGYMVIAFTFGQPNLAEVCALIIGALLAFLWFNVHPAQIFMGDSGSLALGATLAVTEMFPLPPSRMSSMAVSSSPL